MFIKKFQTNVIVDNDDLEDKTTCFYWFYIATISGPKIPKPTIFKKD